MTFNTIPLTRIAASLAKAMDIKPPAQADAPLPQIETFVKDHCVSGKAERMLIYNPDAIGQWLIQKYTDDFAPVMRHTQLAIPFLTAFPPVTPVCFATMYTGAAPEIHGIRKYEKPVVKTDSLFDAFVRAGKRVALSAITGSSMGIIWSGKDIDYFLEKDGEASTARALELLDEDKYDVIVVYTMEYDDNIHATHPESPVSHASMVRHNQQFAELAGKTAFTWKQYDTLLVYATDHGIHKTIFGTGNHYADIPEDMNVTEFFGIQPAEK